MALGALEVAGSRFTRCSAPYGGGGAILLTDRDGGSGSGSKRTRGSEDREQRSGPGLGDVSGSSWTQLNISGSAFEECAASVAGGAVAMVNYGESMGAAVVLAGSNFTHGAVGAGDGTDRYYAFGGGVYMFYSQDVVDSNHSYSGCTFANNSLSSSGRGDSNGGGLYLEYGSDSSVTSSPVSLDGE